MISRFFKKSSQSDSNTSKNMNNDMEKSDQNLVSPPKFPKPKILLLDLDEDTEQTLIKSGYYVETGSLGKPYKAEKSSGYAPVVRNYEFPQNFVESEIVISDFCPSEILESPNVEITIPLEETNYWSHLRYGIVDPRIVTATLISEDLFRILNSGGIFIVFANSSYPQEIKLGRKEYNSFQTIGRENLSDIYSTLGLFGDYNIKDIEGTEIYLEIDENSGIGNLINNYLGGISFTTTFRSRYDSRYDSFAKNKFNQSVSGFCKFRKGGVFIFPQIADKANFIKDLLSDVLPELFPRLFPFSESRSWLLQDEYELPEIVKLNLKIENIEKEAKTKIEEIEATIESKHQEFSYLGDLLTKSADELVEAVIKTLNVLGFKKVIDADETMTDEEENSRGKMEDIQILDYEPELLIEVKGVSGLLKDEDALAVNKYVTARMREWKKTEIKGLTIVNHQRNLPPLDRENNIPFRDIILTNAEENLIGLLTTWELYKLTSVQSTLRRR